jgi:hypothetical protein
MAKPESTHEANYWRHAQINPVLNTVGLLIRDVAAADSPHVPQLRSLLTREVGGDRLKVVATYEAREFLDPGVELAVPGVLRDATYKVTLEIVRIPAGDGAAGVSLADLGLDPADYPEQEPESRG